MTLGPEAIQPLIRHKEALSKMKKFIAGSKLVTSGVVSNTEDNGFKLWLCRARRPTKEPSVA